MACLSIKRRKEIVKAQDDVLKSPKIFSLMSYGSKETENNHILEAQIREFPPENIQNWLLLVCQAINCCGRRVLFAYQPIFSPNLNWTSHPDSPRSYKNSFQLPQTLAISTKQWETAWYHYHKVGWEASPKILPLSLCELLTRPRVKTVRTIVDTLVCQLRQRRIDTCNVLISRKCLQKLNNGWVDGWMEGRTDWLNNEWTSDRNPLFEWQQKGKKRGVGRLIWNQQWQAKTRQLCGRWALPR